MEQLFPGQLVAPTLHFLPMDPFNTVENTNRANRFGIGGNPTFLVDGINRVVGTPSCSGSINTYSDMVSQRLLDTNGSSPVQITGELTINGNLAHVTAHYVLVDGGHSYTAHQATLYLYEDSVHWCCGNGLDSLWNGITRMVRSSALTLTNVGEVKTVTQTLNLSGFVVPVQAAHLHPLAVFEEAAGDKTIIQASDFVALDYALLFPRRVASLPAGNGQVYIQGSVSNFARTADVIHLATDTGFGWPADFQVQGDPNHYTARDVSLDAGETRSITVRVSTDGIRRIGAGKLSAQSQTTGRASSVALRVFNAAAAVLLVRAGGDEDSNEPFTRAMDSAGDLYDTVDHAAVLDQMRGYNCVIWQTAYADPAITSQQKDNLSAYLDQGGTLFLSGMGVLSQAWLPDTFLTSYLGVSSWVDSTGSVRAVGTPGDPISDGMNMALSWQHPQDNQVDTVSPAAGANTVLSSDTGAPEVIRYTGVPFRTVFSTICQDAFPTTGEDPDNSQSFILRTLAWLLSFDPTATPAAPARAPGLVLSAGPNPARDSSVLRYVLRPGIPASAVVTILDAGGRARRTIRSQGLQPGLQRTVWDLTDDGGRPVPAGLYFARVQTTEGTATAKVVVTR